VIYQPVSVVSQCLLNAWLKELVNGDQCRLMGSGSALEVCSRRCAVQLHSLLYLLCNAIHHSKQRPLKRHQPLTSTCLKNQQQTSRRYHHLHRQTKTASPSVVLCLTDLLTALRTSEQLTAQFDVVMMTTQQDHHNHRQ